MLSEPIAAGRVVRFGFVRVGESQVLPREVEPLGWRFVRGQLYLLAYDRNQRARRRYASTRISAVEVLEARSTHASEAPGTDLLGTAEGPETLPPLDVEVVMTPVGAHQLAARPLSAQQVETRLPDGSVRVEARVAGLLMTVDRVVSRGGEARAVSPRDLVELVLDRFRRGLELHEGDTSEKKVKAPDRVVSDR